MGELAAHIAASELCSASCEAPDNDNILRAAVYRINDEIVSRCERENVDIMATTMAALRFSDSGISLCNVGDSRIYRLSSGKLARLSLDQTCPAPPGAAKPRLSQSLGKKKGLVQ